MNGFFVSYTWIDGVIGGFLESRLRYLDTFEKKDGFTVKPENDLYIQWHRLKVWFFWSMMHNRSRALGRV